MPVPIDKQVRAVAWIREHIRPLIASLASKGSIDGIEAMEILDGLDGVEASIAFLQKHGSAIKRAASQ